MDASVPNVVVTSFPNIPANKIMSTLNGTEQWCWSSSATNPYLKVDFGNYSVICSMQFYFNGRIELSYGNESLNISQVNIISHFLSFVVPSWINTTYVFSVDRYVFCTIFPIFRQNLFYLVCMFVIL